MAIVFHFPSVHLLYLLILFFNFCPLTLGEIRFSKIRSDGRSAIPLDEFGFTHSGRLTLNVSDISFSVSTPNMELGRLGFLLCTRDSWFRVLELLQDGDAECALQTTLVKTIYIFDQLKGSRSFSSEIEVIDSNLYTLLLINCLPNVKISMNVWSSMYNLEGKAGIRDYLSVGKTVLPRIYFSLFLIYLGLVCVWIYILYKNRLNTYRIHLFMLAVVALKTLNLLCEAEDKSYIKRTGTAHGWDVLFYIFSFLKGITLFSLIVLIGTGWSFLKPYLQDNEKRVLMIVIPLQIVANLAQMVIDETGPYGQNSDTWKQVFLLVDVICCCAVLFPIVWSIKKLREAARTDGKAAVNLRKLMLFRQYYIVVICYIYFTRVLVYALEIITSYRYQWTGIVAAEMGTLAFYGFTGYNFRPKVHNPYLVIDDEEEDAAAMEVLKFEDEFEL